MCPYILVIVESVYVLYNEKVADYFMVSCTNEIQVDWFIFINKGVVY